MLTTTLTKIREHGPCADGWKKLLDGLGVKRTNKKPLPLERILEINGLDDALWALRAVDGHDNAIRLYACYCAKYVIDIYEKKYPNEKRPRNAIETAEKFAHGNVTKDELAAARAAARDAARDDFRKEFIRLCRLEGEYGEVNG